MFILKLVGKILLLPVWLILFVIGLAVKMTVQTYAVVRGILGFIFTLLIIATAYCYHDWVQVAFLFSLIFIFSSRYNKINNTFSCHVQYSIYEHSCKKDQIQNYTQRKQKCNLYPVMVTVCSRYNQQSEYKPKDPSDNRISLYCHLYCQADHKKDQPYRQ